MHAQKKKKIARIAQNLLRQAGYPKSIRENAVNVKEIAEDILDIRVIYAAIEKGKNVAGMLMRQNGKAFIGVKQHDVTTRQRFTIAHEIGHFLLHKHKDHYDQVLPARVQYRDELSTYAVDSDEIEANAFAAELLMPEPWVTNDFYNCLEKGGFDIEVDVSELAGLYEVSTQAMTFRLLNLKLIRL